MNVHEERVVKSLQSGLVTGHTGFGNSMLPVIRSGQKQTLVPVLTHAEAARLGCQPYDPKGKCEVGDRLYIHPDRLEVGMPVYCQVGGNFYTHKIRGIQGIPREPEDGKTCEASFQISRQDERKVNGWTRQIYGKCVRVE